jgi:hypothetical protein
MTSLHVSWPAQAGHPRLSMVGSVKSWVAGPSPAMTRDAAMTRGDVHP